MRGVFHIYQDGIYTPSWEAIERAMITLIPALKDAQRKETLKQLNLICDSKKPDPPELIAFSNGLFNIRDDSFADFTPEIVITNKIPWPYNPAAYSELLDHTLDKIACGKREIRELLEEMIGSCFYRSNTIGGSGSFILTGEGANGKSTLLDALKYLMGDQNIASLDLKELGDRFKTAELFGKLVNIGDDSSLPLNGSQPTIILYLCRPLTTRMTLAYPRPAYLRNTSNSRCSISRLRLSCSCGERTGVRFLTVIVRSPSTAVLISLSYLTCACIKSLPCNQRMS